MIAKVSRTDSPEPTATLPASDTSVPAGGVAIPRQPKRRLAWSNSCFVLVVAPRPTPPLIGYRKPCTPVELRSLTKCGRPTAFEVQLLRQIPPKIKRNRMILPPDLGGTPIAVYRLRIRGARLPTNERRFTNMDGRLDETSKHPLLRFLSYLKPNAQLVVGAALMGIGKFTLPLAFPIAFRSSSSGWYQPQNRSLVYRHWQPARVGDGGPGQACRVEHRPPARLRDAGRGQLLSQLLGGPCRPPTHLRSAMQAVRPSAEAPSFILRSQ